MPDVVTIYVPLDTIDPNPFRRLGDYPYIERKVRALMRSYADVGMWPGGVIARARDNRHQIAFGHHRVEAARRANLKTAALTILDLTDEQMLGYMGRENMEDYNADFLVMLETWEAAVGFAGRARLEKQPTDIARVLGWTNPRTDRKFNELNDTASACVDTLELIEAGLVTRADLVDLTVKDVREICGSARATMRQVAALTQRTKIPLKEATSAQKQIGKAVVRTATEKREGKVSQRDLRGTVAVHTYRFAREAKKEGQTPLFTVFAKSLAKQIGHWNNTDTVRERIKEMAKALPDLVAPEDIQVVDRVVFALELSIKRNEDSIKTLTAKPASIVRLRAVKGGVA
jgi:ParB-like chromosome segregation protein Spo0J